MSQGYPQRGSKGKKGNRAARLFYRKKCVESYFDMK